MIFPAEPNLRLVHSFIKPAVLLFLTHALIYSISTPWLHVDGTWLKDPDGNNVVLRGIAVLPPKDQKNRFIPHLSGRRSDTSFKSATMMYFYHD